MSKPAGNTNQTPTPSNRLPKLLAGVLLGLVALYLYFSSTLVQGIEFHPGTWQMRTFRFRADPLSGFQWSAIRHDTGVHKADPSVIALLDSRTKQTLNRWDLAEIKQLGTTQSGPSAVMLQLLTGYGVDRGYRSVQAWNQWTAQNPKQAKLFWPALQELAVLGAYPQIPNLLELPFAESSDDQFALRLNQQMLRSLKMHIALCIANQDEQAAAEAAAVGLRYAPDDPEMTELVGPQPAKTDSSQ